MEVIGKLILILPEQSGDSARGHWVRGGFVIETEEQYPKKIAFDAFGEDRIAEINRLNIGEVVRVSFSVESREYNNRWYTNCRFLRVETFNSPAGNNEPTTSYAAPQYSQGNNFSAQTNANAQSSVRQTPDQSAGQNQVPTGGGTIEQEPMSASGSEEDLPF